MKREMILSIDFIVCLLHLTTSYILQHDPYLQIPLNEEGEALYQDSICQACSAVCLLLNPYPPVTPSSKKGGNSTPSNDKDVLEEKPLPDGSDQIIKRGLASDIHKMDNVTGRASSPHIYDENGLSIGETSATGVGILDHTKEIVSHANCALGTKALENCPVKESKPIFLSKNWRDGLCSCEKCTDMDNRKGMTRL